MKMKTRRKEIDFLKFHKNVNYDVQKENWLIYLELFLSFFIAIKDEKLFKKQIFEQKMQSLWSF